LKITQVIIL